MPITPRRCRRHFSPPLRRRDASAAICFHYIYAAELIDAARPLSPMHDDADIALYYAMLPYAFTPMPPCFRLRATLLRHY